MDEADVMTDCAPAFRFLMNKTAMTATTAMTAMAAMTATLRRGFRASGRPSVWASVIAWFMSRAA